MLWKPFNALALKGAAVLWSAKVFNQKQTHFAAFLGILQQLMRNEADETAKEIGPA